MGSDRSPNVYIDPGPYIFSMVVGTVTSILISVATRHPTEGGGTVTTLSAPQNALATNLPFNEIIGHSPAELQAALSLAEAQLSHGESVRLDLVTNSMPTGAQLEAMHAQMIAGGHHVSRPTAFRQDGLPVVQFTATKGSPVLLALIPFIPTAIIGGLIVFGLSRIESISKALLPLMLVTVGGIVILATVVTRKAPLEAASKFLSTRR